MTAAPRRRWFRFSLRATLIVVTLAAIVFGWIAWKLRGAHWHDGYLFIGGYGHGITITWNYAAFP